MGKLRVRTSKLQLIYMTDHLETWFAPSAEILEAELIKAYSTGYTLGQLINN